MSVTTTNAAETAANLSDQQVRAVLLDLKDHPGHGVEKTSKFSPFVFKRLESEGLLVKVPAPREPGRRGPTPMRYELTPEGRRRTAGRRPANLERMIPIMNAGTPNTPTTTPTGEASVAAAGRKAKVFAKAPDNILAKMLDPDPEIGKAGRVEYDAWLAEQEKIKADREANRRRPGRPPASRIDEAALVEAVAVKVVERIRAELGTMITETVNSAVGLAVSVALNAGIGSQISDGLFGGIDRIKETLAEIVRENVKTNSAPNSETKPTAKPTAKPTGETKAKAPEPEKAAEPVKAA